MTLLEIRGPRLLNDWKLYRIVEWEGEAFPHGVLFPGIPAEEIRRAVPAGPDGRLNDNGMIVSTTQFFLLLEGSRAIVVEAGTGNGKSRPAEPYWDHQNLPYAETLRSLGVGADDVEYLFLSHLHVDHVGLATTWADGAWRPTFPRAQSVLDGREWAYWNGPPAGNPKPPPCIADSVRPLVEAGRVRFARDGDRIGPLRMHAAPGHTPGHLLFEMESAGFWFIGDMMHHPAQAAHPDWSAADWDIDAGSARSQRADFFRRFARTGATLLAPHLGGPFRLEELSADSFAVHYETPADG
jgi:glyoxylase-like metal-dependent hydrolase (beta-lactamase superfamily II)